MYSVDNGSSAATVPAFLTKLWALVEDPSTNDLICWDPTGHSFHVYEQGQFAKDVLPYYFKHSNIASFIRQLNMYGFRKVSSIEQGVLKVEREDMEFQHQYFQHGREDLLDQIKRKVSSVKGGLGGGGMNEDTMGKLPNAAEILTKVQIMSNKQSVMTNKMDSLKAENQALWREVATLRQKHQKQQQIVNKLIQFLVSLVGSNRGLPTGVKRKMPLMLNEPAHLTPSPPKAPKLTRPLSIEGNENEHDYTVQSPNANQSTVTIKDVTEQLQSRHTIPTVPAAQPFIQSPVSVKSPGETQSVAPSPIYVLSPDGHLIPLDNAEVQDQIVVTAPAPAVNIMPAVSTLTPSTVPPAATSINHPTNVKLQRAVPVRIVTRPKSKKTVVTKAPVAQHPAAPIKVEVRRVTPVTHSSAAHPGAVAVTQTDTLGAAPALSADPVTTLCKTEPTSLSKEEVVDHLDTLQENLDFLKSNLTGLTVDSDVTVDNQMALMQLFGPQYPLSTSTEHLGILESLGLNEEEEAPTIPSTSSSNIVGNEVIQYMPPDMESLLDLDGMGYSLLDDANAMPEMTSTLNTPNLDNGDPTDTNLFDQSFRDSIATDTSMEDVL